MSQDLKTRVLEDVKTAMRAQEKLRLSVLRMLTAEMKQREVVDSVELTDAVVSAAIEKMIKQRRDSEKQYTDGGRPELAAKEAEEIKILMVYLPEQLTADELVALVKQAVAETGAVEGKDMGKVMAWIKPKAQGRTDMGKVSGLIKAQLAG
ncbi:GatB/YqeY domain-containing protein [Stenotrophobium rhamnosiphilum]|uniref:Glutamyl-tRNA amidotransferase n=1 Tax=Stenotrophobium rhamnosiphilum TaxID=2029166 RepID=A0A2T5MBF1_9GAMM|nr:GatB/YqeY domain-containing protein [Stenotrophobium rhamnosiphilum]PTU29081.1 glutamyl-tRNA amidotransferase [Stenotrophobium rhamnosiphilum]